MPGPVGDAGQPKWPGPAGNPRGQLVGCGQRTAHLMAAHTQPLGGKLGLAMHSVDN